MTAAIYLRKSRAEEHEPVAETLARHREILQEYARAEKLDIARVFEEVASGDSLYGRPEMLKLLEQLPAYDAVLCMDIDRLGRGAMHEQGLIFETFRNAGVLIITPSKTYDMTDDMDDSLISFKALFAREEYKMIRTRLRRGTMKALSEGCYLSNAPFGYKQTRVNKKPTLAVVPEEAEGVRLIYTLYCEGQGCQSIADTLHALGYRPRRGQKFNRTTIAKIIRNPVYIGKVAWNQLCPVRPSQPGQKSGKRIKPREEWTIADGMHDAIIGEELYNKANERLSGRYHPPHNKGGVVKNPFAGFLYCANCGMSMVRQALENRRYNQPILLCPTAGCTMASALATVEDILYTTIEDALNAIKAKPAEALPACPAGVDMTEAARSELTKLRRQEGKLHDFLEQGLYDAETFLNRRRELRERMSAAQVIIDNSAKVVCAEELRCSLESLLEQYWNGSPLERNQLYKSTIKRAIYRKPKGSGWGSLPTIEIAEWRI